MAQQKGGDFEIRNLEPGDYTIQIDAPDEPTIVLPAEAGTGDVVPAGSPAASAAAVNATAKNTKKFYGQRWYPDVPRMEMAATIHVAEGESRRLDISLESRETHTLTGTLQAPREFQHAPVTIALRSPGARDGRTAQMRAPGAFRIENLSPGTYRLAFTAGKPPNEVAGDYPFEITREDIDNFKAALTPEAGVSGEIRMAEGGAALPARAGIFFKIFFMVPASGWVALVKGGGMLVGGDLPVTGAPVKAGKFHQESIRPGEYWPVLLDLPEGYAIAETRFEGATAHNSAMTLIAQDTPVTFVVTSRPGAVGGTVRDENQAPAGGVPVALLPDPMPDKPGPGAIRVEKSGDDGAFFFRDVAPGMYRAVVLSGDGAESDVAHLRELAAKADAIEVRAGQSANIALKR